MASKPRSWICGICGVRQVANTPGAHYTSTCTIDNDEFADMIISKLDNISFDVNYSALKWHMTELRAMMPPRKK